MRQAPGVPDMVASNDGVFISYESRGDGKPALVFVHGWSCDRGYWAAQLDWFADAYQVVAVDLAGHGESGTERQVWTVQAFGEDVAAVADHLGLDRIVLIGHSMGGDVIVDAARLLPGTVDALIMVDTYKQLAVPRTNEEIRRLVGSFHLDFKSETRNFVGKLFLPGSNPQIVERVVEDMSSAPPDIALAALEASFANDSRLPSVLQDLNLPVVAINPDTPPTDEKSMQRYGVEVVLVPDVGHFLMMEKPGQFNRVLTSVLENLNRASA